MVKSGTEEIGVIVRFNEDIPETWNFDKYKVDYFLKESDLNVIEQYNQNNHHNQIQNNDIIGWALKIHRDINETAGARGKRYLFWNYNSQRISETIFELAGLMYSDILEPFNVFSNSLGQIDLKKSTNVIQSLEIGGKQKQPFKVDKTNNIISPLLILCKQGKKTKEISLPFYFPLDFVSKKMPLARSRGGRIYLEELSKLQLIQTTKSGTIKWKITQLGKILIKATQSWIISSLSKKLSV